MSRHNKTGRSKGEPRHVRIYHWLMETAAWQSLNATQRAIYLEMAARYAGPGSNNGKLPYSIREAAESLGIGKTTAARALDVLEQRGFVVPITKGAFSRKVRHATEWRLTEFPCDVTHALPSKEFARWSPEIQNTVPPQTSTVPETGPIGTREGTEVPQKAPDGTCGGTVEPQNANSRYLRRDTISLPGAESSEPVPVPDERPAARHPKRAQAPAQSVQGSTELASSALVRGERLRWRPSSGR